MTHRLRNAAVAATLLAGSVGIGATVLTATPAHAAVAVSDRGDFRCDRDSEWDCGRGMRDDRGFRDHRDESSYEDYSSSQDYNSSRAYRSHSERNSGRDQYAY